MSVTRSSGSALIAAAAASVLLAGCITGEPTAGQVAGAAGASPVDRTAVAGIGGEQEWSGSIAAAGVDLTMAARDERGWLILWQLVGEDPPGTLPDDTMALAVFLGPRPTGGYSIEIDEIIGDGEGTVVRYGEQTPGSGANTSQAVTAPYRIVLVPDTDGVVHFERTR